MSHQPEYNPQLPESWQFIPPKEGGNGAIHRPGQYRNIIWQTRRREPEPFEFTLITALETLFDQGINTLEHLIPALNQQRVFDRRGNPWTEDSFRDFLRVNGD
ncbi:recombinase-like helix-turn-helix domain-containing protein [Erwinia sp. AnSW2-5]|uniref:recombinase-like helix-turn-helix domain-containing protein n=1 Tax=Erwinia sp. AnSW2-5 TaxID=3367692 RepID=UPI003858811A